MRFSIRDLLWAMLVVGLGWWLDHRAIEGKNDQAIEVLRAHIDTVRVEISADIQAGRIAEAQIRPAKINNELNKWRPPQRTIFEMRSF